MDLWPSHSSDGEKSKVLVSSREEWSYSVSVIREAETDKWFWKNKHGNKHRTEKKKIFLSSLWNRSTGGIGHLFHVSILSE